jgi:hypothetical protein
MFYIDSVGRRWPFIVYIVFYRIFHVSHNHLIDKLDHNVMSEANEFSEVPSFETPCQKAPKRTADVGNGE